jgi:hypothetical protein
MPRSSGGKNSKMKSVGAGEGKETPMVKSMAVMAVWGCREQGKEV